MPDKLLRKFIYLDEYNENGKRKRTSVSGKNQSELLQNYKKKLIDIEKNQLLSRDIVTVREWCDRWLEIFKKGKVQSSWYNGCRSKLEIYLYPNLGNKNIKKITMIDLQIILNKTENMSYSQVTKLRTELKAIFKAAQKQKLITDNPAEELILPKYYKNQRRSLTQEEENAFYKAVEKHPRGLMFRALLELGIRPQEIFVLTKDKLDKEHKLMIINEAQDVVNYKIKDTKTKAGVRNIPIPDKLYDELIKIDTEFLFPMKNGNMMNRKTFDRAWKSFKREMDITAGAKVYRNELKEHKIAQEITPYYLRHTYCTHLAEMGIDLKTAQYLMGHSDIKVTAEIYSHVNDKMISNAREKLNEFYK